MPRLSCRSALVATAATVALVAAACAKPGETVDAGPPPAAPVVDAGPPPAPVDVSAIPKPVWDPESLDAAELRKLDGYAAFSVDGLAFAFAAPSEGAGVPVLSFVSSTTQTVERSVALSGKESKLGVARELVAGGFPRPSELKPVPPVLGAKVEDGKVQLSFSGMPASTPVAAEQGAKVKSASILAVSADGKKVALKLTLRGTGEFAGTVVRIVPLFE